MVLSLNHACVFLYSSGVNYLKVKKNDCIYNSIIPTDKHVTRVWRLAALPLFDLKKNVKFFIVGVGLSGQLGIRIS